MKVTPSQYFSPLLPGNYIQVISVVKVDSYLKRLNLLEAAILPKKYGRSILLERPYMLGNFAAATIFPGDGISCVTISLTVWSCGDRQFWTVTDCDPGCSSKCSRYWSDHPSCHLGI